MSSALWVSKTGLAAQDKAMATIANNLANVNTTGFKSDRAVFEDLFYAIELQPGAQADQVNTVPSGIQLGSGVRIAGTQSRFTVGSDGIVTAVLPGDTNPVELGQITLVNFVNPAGLEALGGNLYKQTVASGEPVEGVAGEEGLGTIKQGVLEGSNVQVVEAMVSMIAIQRAYEANAKVLDASSSMQQFLNQNL